MIHIIDLNFQGVVQSIAAFAVESTSGIVLVETGPHSTLPHLEKGLQRIGFEAKDVRHVLLSHIHLDHAGAAWYFAQNGANIYVHPRGVKHLNQPERLMDSARRIYQEKMDVLWGQMNPIPMEQLHSIEDNETIQIANLTFEALHTPGHAYHHIAWKLDNIIFSGDVGGVKIGAGIVVPPCPPPDINIEAWQTSINLLKKLNPDSLYLTHFGKIDQPILHLEELEKRLLSWANWIRPFVDAETPIQEIIPKFEAFVKEELLGGGLNQDGLQQYESSNPSWMSVAGLMRYWKKQKV